MTTTKHVLRMTRKPVPCPPCPPCQPCPPCDSCLDKPGALIIQSTVADILAALVDIEPSIATITDIAGVDDFIIALSDMLNINGIPELIERLNRIKVYQDIVVDVVPYIQSVIDGLIDWFTALDELSATPEIELPLCPCDTLPYYLSNTEFAVKIPGCLADSSLVEWSWEFDDPLVTIEDYFEFTPIDMGLFVRAYSGHAAVGILTITYSYPELDAPTPATIEFIEGASVPLVLERPTVDDDASVRFWFKASNHSFTYWPDNFIRHFTAIAPTGQTVTWHTQLTGLAVDTSGFGYGAIISANGNTLSMSVDSSPNLLHLLGQNLDTARDFDVWFTVCGQDSPKTTLVFDNTGAAFSGNTAVGILHDTSGDIGFTTRTYQFKLDSTSGLYVPYDLDVILLVADCQPVGRECIWHYQFEALAADTLPAGLTAIHYNKPKLMIGPALAIVPTITPPCSQPGIAALGTLTVWLEIVGAAAGAVNTVATIIFIEATPGVTC